MLPVQYQLPAAIVLLIGGVVACFFGYRLFRIVLSIFGFILGALLASSVFGASDTGPMIIAAIVGGLIGAAVLFAAYFLGVAAFLPKNISPCIFVGFAAPAISSSVGARSIATSSRSSTLPGA